MKKMLVLAMFVSFVFGQAVWADERDGGPEADRDVPVALPTIKKQIFLGGSFLRQRPQNKQSMASTGGFALIIPLSEEMFIRPFVSGGVDTSTTGKSFPIVQSGALFGYRVTPRVSVLGGGGMNFLFPRDKPNETIPALMIGTLTKLNRSWSLLVPVAFSRRGTDVGVQLGYAW